MPSHHFCFFFLQVTERLLEVENETMMKVADLEKLLLQKDKDLQAVRVSMMGKRLHFRFVLAEIRFACTLLNLL